MALFYRKLFDIDLTKERKRTKKSIKKRTKIETFLITVMLATIRLKMKSLRENLLDYYKPNLLRLFCLNGPISIRNQLIRSNINVMKRLYNCMNFELSGESIHLSWYQQHSVNFISEWSETFFSKVKSIRVKEHENKNITPLERIELLTK